LEKNLNNDQKLPISKIINTLLTDKKIQDESLIEGVDNNDGRAGFIHGANFVLDVIKKNCLLNDFRWFKKEF
jgi:di/tripeptidase